MRYVLLPALALILAACSEQAPTTKRYPIQGEVMALDAAAKTATIKHNKIDNWMEAMTMEFPVKPDGEFKKLHVGDRIEGTVVAQDLRYYVTDVKIAPK